MSSNSSTAVNQKTVSKGYKYFMVFLCMLTQAIPYGIAQNIQPLFVHPLVNTFHFTLASYTLIFTFGAIASSIASPFIGKGLEKINFRLMYLIGIGCSAVAYVIFGISTKLPGFYLAAIICMIGSTFFSGQGVPWVINHWFPAKGRGAALGIAFCGGSIGNIILQPTTQAILKQFMTGNTKTGHLTSMAPFFIFAIALLVVGVIISFFIRTPKKNEVVATAEELKESKDAAAKAKAHEFQGWTSKEVVKMKWFWIFSLGFLIIGLGLASLNEDYAAFLDTKMSLTDVGLVGSMYGVGCLIGNVSGGILFDKFGTAKSMTYAGCMYVLSIAMMIIISLQPYGSSMSRIIGMAYSIFCGLAVFSYMSGPAFMAKDLFGAKEQGVMLGYVGLAYAIGYAIGAPLFGIIKGMASFTVAWYFMMAFVIIGFILLVVSVIRIKKIQKEYITKNEKQVANE
ncbi:MAG: conjugated bile salt MFS transporter [Lactobacillus crispatus]|jgi:MFS family permease|nr:conjugated bile salt MFS transporter [Lactobacillus crispatus]MCI1335970.1 conjugated bile salt MFS transporter [Lactobacillus crispatus]MCI1365396.1 conjugated bile salt MFS transporter [Lactobacillus crispatus]MCI1493944.1 conjugated bile salt MFS transporter [Lactobacillus crispatus]MCI1524168.1 conjugated bile salt MFS transporter [Lactobacillus crispatus]